jgi:hypothetical protein
MTALSISGWVVHEVFFLVLGLIKQIRNFILMIDLEKLLTWIDTIVNSYSADPVFTIFES